jgi:phosphohistidine phosphatase
LTSNPRHDWHQLVLVRHAKSSWNDPTLTDHDRPLAARGHKALRRMRAHLEELGIRPDVVLCSSARRTVETLDGIREALGAHPLVEIDDRLYAAGADRLFARLAVLGDEVRCALVVAHNPGIADLVELLTARDDAAPPLDVVPTGAIAVLSFTGPWRDLGPAVTSLDGIWRPRPPR